MLWNAPGAVDRHRDRLRPELAGPAHDRRRPARLSRSPAPRAPSSCPTSPRRSPSRPTAARPTRSPSARASGSRPARRSSRATSPTRSSASSRRPGPAGGFYASLVGAEACAKKPKTCDLSEGVVADDAAGTVTFKLTAPDPDLLQKLAMPFAFVVPKGTPNKDIGTDPLPATGPYMIERYDARLGDGVRAQPGVRGVVGRGAARRQPRQDRDEDRAPARGRDDADPERPGGLDVRHAAGRPARARSSTKYEQQFHINPGPQVYHMALNTRVAPFDKVEVRQALNFATDRDAVIKIFGGPALARASCQILPPDFPGYEPYCPYTKNPGEKWSAPDMAKAQAAGRRVRHQGPEGHDHLDERRDDEGDRPLLRLACCASSATTPASRPSTAACSTPTCRTRATRRSSASATGSPTTRRARTSSTSSSAATASRPTSTSSPNLPEFCDPAIQKKTEQALKLESTDRDAANAMWAEIDKATTDAAPLGLAVRRQPPRLRVRAARQLPVQPVRDRRLHDPAGLGEVRPMAARARSRPDAGAAPPGSGAGARRLVRNRRDGVAGVLPSCARRGALVRGPRRAHRPVRVQRERHDDRRRREVAVVAPNASGLGSTPIGPTLEGRYFLGADAQGRDVMARMLYGGRASLPIGRRGGADHAADRDAARARGRASSAAGSTG